MALIDRQTPDIVSATDEIDIRPQLAEQDMQLDPTLPELLGAAFRLDNPVVSLSQEDRELGDDTAESDYDYQSDVIGTEYEPFLDRFAYETFNEQQKTALKKRIDRQQEDRRIVDAGGWAGIGATGLAAVLSPDILLPGGAILKSGRAGYSMLRSGASVGLAAGAAAGVAETALQASQDIRTAQETTLAVSGSVLFGAFLGGAAGAVMSKAERAAAIKIIEKGVSDNSDRNVRLFNQGVNEPVSGGAAAVPPSDPADFDIAGKTPKAVGRALRKYVPVIRDSFRVSPVYKSTMADLGEVSVGLNRNIRGEGTYAAETAAKYWEQGVWGAAATRQREIYATAKKNGFTGSYREFDEAVGRAFSDGDQSPIPEVAQAASNWRKSLFDPLAREGIDVGVLTQEQIDGILRVNRGYRPRVYNTRRIIAEKAQFSEQVLPEIKAIIRATQASQKAPEFVSNADFEDYANRVFQEFYDKVTGQQGIDTPDFITSNLRGPLKERTLNIKDSALEGFIESSAEFLGRRQARMMGADVEIARKFGRPDMKDQITRIKEDYDKIAAKEPDTAKKSAIERERIDAVEDLEARLAIIRGRYKPELESSNVGRILRAANIFNFVRAMGGVVAASMSDAVRPAMVNGLQSYMQDGIVPLITNLKGFKLVAEQARIMGAAAERIGAGRIATLAEINDPYAIGSPFERFLNNMGTTFAKMTGLLHWNDFHKTLSATIAQNRVLRNVTGDFDALTPREREFQGFLGLNKSISADIAKQFEKYGQNEGGLYIANFHNWDDPEAARAFVAAINKDTNTTIVTKSAGDVPNFMHTPAGRALFQFKSFAIASNQRVLMRGLQGGMDRFVGGMVGMTTIGMAIYWFKQMEAGREVSNNPGTWIAEGFDRSGVMAIGMEINNIYEKLNGYGIYSGLADVGQMLSPGADERQPASRYAVRNQFGALMGPTFGLGTDLTTLTGVGINAATGNVEMAPSDISAARRLTPFASLPYWRWLIDGGFGLQDNSGFTGVVPELKEAVD